MTDDVGSGGARPAGDPPPRDIDPTLHLSPGASDAPSAGSSGPGTPGTPPPGPDPVGPNGPDPVHPVDGSTDATAQLPVDPTLAASDLPTDAAAAPPGDPRPAGADVNPVGERETPAAGRAARHRHRHKRVEKAEKSGKSGKAAKPRRKAPWWELPALVVLAILIAIVVKTFLVQPFFIPSESMEKTLHGCTGCHGDRILVNKIIYDFRDPHPGDIVVFNAPPGWDDEPTSKPPGNPVLKGIRGFGQLIGFVPPDGQVLVKRVIATAGQTVKGDAQGNVQVSKSGPNGPFRTLNEPFVFVDKGQEGNQRPFGPVTVPKGRLWVMGDHRNDSADSRYHCGPNGQDTTDDTDCDPTPSTVPVDDVIGKAFVIAWPPSRWRTLGTPSTFEGAAAASASGVPALVSAGVVLPVFAVRRRRRRR